MFTAPFAKSLLSVGEKLLRSAANRPVNSSELFNRNKELLGNSLISVGRRFQQAWPELKVIARNVRTGDITVSQTWHASKVAGEAGIIFCLSCFAGRAIASGFGAGYDYADQL